MPLGDASPPVDDPLIGRVLADRYRIVRKIGEGGMGCVYQAQHALIEKKIALKVLFQDLTRRAELVARFLQEAKSASRIGHENVIDIFDFGQSADGLVFIAMEYLDGQELGRVLKNESRLAWGRAQPILMQIVKALRAAHASGVIHRDMKPENVYLVQRDGRPDFVKVLDFGIAKIVSPDDNDGPRLTQTGMIFGTPEYMSPEQAQGNPPDHRVDVYAVGCIMYQMLTGSVPFSADNFMGVLTKHLLEPPVPPRQRRPDLDIPLDVEQVCLRALEKNRDKRWPDMDSFYRALGAAGGVPFEPSDVFAPGASPGARRSEAPRLGVEPRAGRGDGPGSPAVSPTPSDRRAGSASASVSAAKLGSTASAAVTTFEDERPRRPREQPSGRVSAAGKLGLVMGVAVLVAAVIVLALHWSSAPPGRDDRPLVKSGAVAPTPGPSAPTAPSVAPSADDPGGSAAARSAPVVPIPAQPEQPAAARTETGAAEGTGAVEGDATAAAKPARRHRRGDDGKPDPLHRRIPIPDETTPAELKNPFSTP